MSNLFKYKIPLDPESAMEEKYQPPSQHTVFYLAFVLVCTITTTFFSAIVMILNYCFPGSLDGTYLKLFF
ncbi:hypothetical protein IQ255_20715 [Pleurocapsales cyanobacterium LEGE 10410]|nr:hypothetical protein [Pleurocapsales cyanobacterium LEGE 10410]